MTMSDNTTDPTREAEIRARAETATKTAWLCDSCHYPCPESEGDPNGDKHTRCTICQGDEWTLTDTARIKGQSELDIDYLLAENQRLRDQMEANEPPCDGGCDYNSGPEESCSLHGRPTAQVWEIVDKVIAERDELKAAASAPTTCAECNGSAVVVEFMMSEFPVPIPCPRCRAASAKATER